MKAHFPRLLIICIAFALVGCAAQEAGTDEGAEVDQEQVRQAIEAQNARFERYVENQQFDSLAAIYTAGGQLMAPNAPTASGQNLIGAFEGMAQMGVSSINLQTMEVEAAEDFAYEVGNYTLQAEGGMEVDNGKYIVIWKQEDGEWKLHRDIFNSNVPPGQAPAGPPADTTQS